MDAHRFSHSAPSQHVSAKARSREHAATQHYIPPQTWTILDSARLRVGTLLLKSRETVSHLHRPPFLMVDMRGRYTRTHLQRELAGPIDLVAQIKYRMQRGEFLDTINPRN